MYESNGTVSHTYYKWTAPNFLNYYLVGSITIWLASLVSFGDWMDQKSMEQQYHVLLHGDEKKILLVGLEAGFTMQMQRTELCPSFLHQARNIYAFHQADGKKICSFYSFL